MVRPVAKEIVAEHKLETRIPALREKNNFEGIKSLLLKAFPSATPLELEVVFGIASENPVSPALPMNMEERAEWIIHTTHDHRDNIGTRVGFTTGFWPILKRAEKDKNFGNAMRGLIHLSKPLRRISLLTAIASMPEEIKVSANDAKRVVHHDNYSEEFVKLMADKISIIIPTKTIGEEGQEALRNSVFLANLFKYHDGYKKDRTSLANFQAGVASFLEKGTSGFKNHKYHSKQAKEIIDHSKISPEIIDFLEGLDKEVGNISSEASSEPVNWFDAYKGKLEDHDNHLNTEDPTKIIDALEEIKKKEPEHKEQIKDFLKQLEKHDEQTAQGVSKLINENNPSEALELLKARQGLSKGKARGIVSALFRPVTELKSVAEAKEIDAKKASKAVEAGKQVVQEFRKLEGKTPQEQIKQLNMAREKFSSPEMNEHLRILNTMGKAVFKDFAFFIEEIGKNRAIQEKESDEEVFSKITHDVSRHYTVGGFENNCQSPGTQQSHSLISFSGEPSELIISHEKSLDGETTDAIGFTLAHLLHKKENEGTRYALVFERPYSNHSNLKPRMEGNQKAMIDRINELAKKRNLPLTAMLGSQAKGSKFRVIEGHVHRWYDLKGSMVRGGEEI